MNERMIRELKPAKQGQFVLYWMQAAQRIEDNPALDYAVDISLQSKQALVAVFCLDESYPEANLRHYYFMLQGLSNLLKQASAHTYYVYIVLGKALDILPGIMDRASYLVCDSGYLNHQKQQRQKLYDYCLDKGLGFAELETECVVPVNKVSSKEEYSAATLRPKILRYLEAETISLAKSREPWGSFRLNDLLERMGQRFFCSQDMRIEEEFMNWALSAIKVNEAVGAVDSFKGGAEEAEKLLTSFVKNKLASYSSLRNHPGLDYQSDLSPYLHFGQISPRKIIDSVCKEFALEYSTIAELIKKRAEKPEPYASIGAFFEELIIRRELSFNFCNYNTDYDSWKCLPNWAKATLADHLLDKRESNYSIDILESAQSLDIYWNAAQMEMLLTGKMHNYMRMYWGKKIIEWSESPELAFEVMLYLNNKYQLDGRDPNSYAGIAWCFGKHDRPWQNRAIFGSVRYMNADGLNRKWKMKIYLDYVASIASGRLEGAYL